MARTHTHTLIRSHMHLHNAICCLFLARFPHLTLSIQLSRASVERNCVWVFYKMYTHMCACVYFSLSFIFDCLFLFYFLCCFFFSSQRWPCVCVVFMRGVLFSAMIYVAVVFVDLAVSYFKYSHLKVFLYAYVACRACMSMSWPIKCLFVGLFIYLFFVFDMYLCAYQ